MSFQFGFSDPIGDTGREHFDDHAQRPMTSTEVCVDRPSGNVTNGHRQRSRYNDDRPLATSNEHERAASAGQHGGRYIRAKGCVKQVFALCGVVEAEDQPGVLYEFRLGEVTYNERELPSSSDLTEVVLPDDDVNFTVDTEMSVGGFGYQAASSSQTWSDLGDGVVLESGRVVDLVLVDYPDPSKRPPQQYLEQEMQVVQRIDGNVGWIKTSRWGPRSFDWRAVTGAHYNDNRRLFNIIHPSRTVIYNMYAPKPLRSSWTIISVKPHGQVFEGVRGVITDVRDRGAVIVSEAFGHIYMPVGAFKLPRSWKESRSDWRNMAWLADLYGQRVMATINQSLNEAPNRWRALKVEPADSWF